MTQPEQESIGKRPYFPQLDGVRAIAVTMVMLFHMNGPIVHLPGPATFGQTGVDLFFVLSGFLITGILLRARQRDWHEVKVFYIRRCLRIFPLYYGTLLIVWTWLMHDHVSWDVWIYLQNITMTMGKWMRGPWHFWSLAVEEQFYLVWPFLVLWLPRKHIGKVLLVMIVLAAVTRAWLLHLGLSTFYLTPARMDALAAGALLALLLYRDQLERLRVAFYAVFALSLMTLLAQQLSLTAHHSLAPFVSVTKFTSLAAFYASGVALLLLGVCPLVNRALASSPMRFVGRISYGLYVFHPFVFLWIETHMLAYSTLARTAAAFTGSYAAALFSWYAMESHLVNLKDRFAPDRKEFPASAPPMAAL